MFKTISRDKRQAIANREAVMRPGVGRYHPKFDLVLGSTQKARIGFSSSKEKVKD